jgi:Flp pilus assembly CpaF family ATPase
LLYQLGDQAHRFISENSLNRQSLSDRLVETSLNVNEHILEALPEINEVTRYRIAEIVSHRTTVLAPLLPILLDEFVEEVYLDRPGTDIYFDHQVLGRCVSSVTLNENDVSRLTTLLRSESNLHLDRRNPSLKTDLKIYDTPLRIAASLPPLSPDGLHLEIRRARKNPFTLVDLIENGTITVEGAALLLLAVALRLNITITGGPGTGKTTLLNALDMSTPRSWRKIYIEDAIESRIQQDRHQIRIRVDPVDETLGLTDKSSEIVKSLHRSPDYLVLGEIQTAEHSQALFQAIAAGIPTMQTCHSASAAGLISRWKSNHDIETSNIAMMDIVVTLNRPMPGKSKRLVKEISEVRRDYENGIIVFKGLNRLYDSDHSIEITWDKNSSYQLHVLERIHQNLESAFDSVVTTLYAEMSNHPSDDSISLCEKAGLGLLQVENSQEI